MPVRPIVSPGAIPALACGGATLQVIEAAQDLVDTMRSLGCHSLSAPLIGLSLRLIAIDPSGTGDAPMILLDPTIAARDGSKSGAETCLVAEPFQVDRAVRIFVRAMTLDGRAMGAECVGEEAVLIQHQIEHLDGIRPGVFT